MRAALVLIGLLAAAVVGAAALLAAGEPGGIAALVSVVAAVLAGLTGGHVIRRLVTGVLLVATIAAGGWLAITAIDVVEALRTTDGPVDAADAAALAAARAVIADAAGEGPFQIALTEQQLTAVVQDGLATNPDVPVRRVDLDVVDGAAGGLGQIAFTATFKAGGLQATGLATGRAEAGRVVLELQDVDFGQLHVPGVGRSAVQDLFESVADLNAALVDHGATIDSITIGGDQIVVTGTAAGGVQVTSEAVLDELRAQASAAGQVVQPPPERLGPGTVDATTAPGSPVVLALGDSLAAGVGAPSLRDGYVARFHRWVSERDGVAYGLHNLGVSGETSASLLTSGQLTQAEQLLATQEAAYITLDIGANDLLGHLESPACADDLRAAACQSLVADTTARYREQLGAALDRLRAAAPDSTIIFLLTYNPFSLGLGAAAEADSDAILSSFNAAAAQVARDRGAVVADGFTPMRGTTAATTHMVDNPPDIHPNASGHDVLASALADALS